ncbi:MAG: VOC family protein [Candidatus Marinimicrobia bacterium]|jgi:catechol-2,3-dioxygenase|uniref:VOC domain-containing protein n=1 Tax=marine metagenome TaxID=408172 RepID=A0A381WIM8_9ZZZZ|nr:VOC family protein [Gammaproteobacteria bacterium]MDP7436614.1 VOC family protein [Candidatus Neomarinimicrobiota bacterium]
MPLESLNHFTLLTANHQNLKDFYSRILGLTVGLRPPVPSTGTWLYCGETPAVHLVELESTPKVQDTQIEHVAFSASGLAELLEHLRDNEVPYQIAVVPDVEIRQVNVFDPDGNHIEIQFAPEEEADLNSFKLETIRDLILSSGIPEWREGSPTSPV